MALWAIQVRGWSGLSSGWTWLPPSPPSPPSPPPALPAFPGPSKAPAITAPHPQVVVAIISFLETTLLIYLSYKVSAPARPAWAQPFACPLA